MFYFICCNNINVKTKMKEPVEVQKVEIIAEAGRCRHVVSILSHEPVLAVDYLGVQQWSRGPLTLIQNGTYSGDVLCT